MHDIMVIRDPGDRLSRRRQARTAPRGDAPVVRVTERDLWILEALVKMRFLTTSLIAQLSFGGSRSAVNKRLRRLLDAGYVKAWAPNLARDNVYSLSRAGRATIVRHSSAGASVHVPSRLDGNLEHLLAINAVRVALATSLPDTGGELLWWRSDWELRAHRSQRTIPDALFTVSWPGCAEQVFALEVEHRTRAPRSLQGKLLRYSAASYRPGGLYGQMNPAVLVVGLSPTWLARYRSALAVLPLALAVGFATLRDVEQAGAGAVWQPLAGDSHLSLRTLATLPYRTEGQTLECGSATRTYGNVVAHIAPALGSTGSRCVPPTRERGSMNDPRGDNPMVYLCPHCGEPAIVLERINGFSRLWCSPCRLRFEQPTARPAHMGYTPASAGDRAPAAREPERVSDCGAQVIIPIRTLRRVSGLAVRGVVGPRRLQTRRSVARR